MIALTLAVVISMLVLGTVASYNAYMLRHHAGWELDQGGGPTMARACNK